MSTDTVAHFVGLDYHKDDIQVCILDQAGAILDNRKVPNDKMLLDTFVRQHINIKASRKVRHWRSLV